MKDSHVELFRDESTKDMIDYVLPKNKIHRAVSQNRYEAKYTFIDDKPEREEDYYYLRITQENGQMAWASPIWVKKE